MTRLDRLTLIVPYYRQPEMLALQLRTWMGYPADVLGKLTIVVIDDGSPEPAAPIVAKFTALPLELYRIGADIAWNRGGARNLGAHVAGTEWIVHTDIDHVLPADAAAALCQFEPAACWYKFPRYRVGRADVTRRKDAIAPQEEFGKIHPHMDSYMIRRADYWRCGGYDEDYSGCLGGGTPFTQLLHKMAKPQLLPPPIRLHVHTQSVVADASVTGLSRDTAEFKRRFRQKGLVKAINPMRFRWTKVE